MIYDITMPYVNIPQIAVMKTNAIIYILSPLRKHESLEHR